MNLVFCFSRGKLNWHYCNQVVLQEISCLLSEKNMILNFDWVSFVGVFHDLLSGFDSHSVKHLRVSIEALHHGVQESAVEHESCCVWYFHLGGEMKCLIWLSYFGFYAMTKNKHSRIKKQNFFIHKINFFIGKTEDCFDIYVSLFVCNNNLYWDAIF